MQLMASLLPLALLGLADGSFLNVLVLRTMVGRSCGGRSACMHCGHMLAWYELIPLFSYLAQAGRCRACGVRLSVQYPLVEALTAFVFVGVALRVCGTGGCSLCGLFEQSVLHGLATLAFMGTHLAVWSALIAICVYDLRTTYIPDRFSYAGAGAALVALVLGFLTVQGTPHTFETFTRTLLAGPLLFLPFYFLWKVSDGRWMGLGDGKLAWGMGWLLGIGGGFSAVMFGFWLGALVALAVLAAQRIAGFLRTQKATKGLFSVTATPDDAGRASVSSDGVQPVSECGTQEGVANSPHAPLTLTSEIPFGPFLVAGTAIVYFTGITYASLFGLDGTLFAPFFGS